jgi:hypothetical protein
MVTHKHKILEEDALRKCIKLYGGPMGSTFPSSSSFVFGSLRMVNVTGQGLAFCRIIRQVANTNGMGSCYVYRASDMHFHRKQLHINNRSTEFEVLKLWEERGMVLKVLTSRK